MSDQNRDDDFLDFDDEDFLDDEDFADLGDADLDDDLTDEDLLLAEEEALADLDDESWNEFDDAPQPQQPPAPQQDIEEVALAEPPSETFAAEDSFDEGGADEVAFDDYGDGEAEYIVENEGEGDDGETAPTASQSPANQSGSAQKSFVSRHFNVLLIGTAVVFGGGFFYTKFLSGNSASPDMVALQQQAGRVDPNQSSPFASQSDGERLSSGNDEGAINLDLNSLRRSENRIPAELPYEKEIGELDAQETVTQVTSMSTSDYAAQELAPEDDLFADGNETIDYSVSEFSDIPRGERLTPMPSVSNLSAEERARAREVSPGLQNSVLGESSAAEKVEAPLAETAQVTSAPQQANPTATAAMAEAAETLASKESELSTLRAQSEQRVQQLQQESAAANTQLKTLTDKNVQLEQNLSSAKQESEKLGQTVKSLEEQVAQLQKQLEAQNKALAEEKAKQAAAAKTAVTSTASSTSATSAATPSATSQTKEAPATTTQKPAATTAQSSSTAAPATSQAKPATTQSTSQPAATSAAPKSQSTPQWVLRSAQTGQAVLADQKTGNVIRVEVGQNVNGLGTIRSIGLVNGVWTVQGTQGSVRR